MVSKDYKVKLFHSLSKDAGNKLRAYILSMSSGVVATVFFILTKNTETITLFEKVMLIFALICFISVVIISLYELKTDSNRFYFKAKILERELQIEKEDHIDKKVELGLKLNEQKKEIKKLHDTRFVFLFSTYFLFLLGIFFISLFFLPKIIRG